MAEWKQEVARLDIVAVAEKLGIQVSPGRRSPRLALCPFHDDSKPSLRLYQDADPHYHCFTCQAHGDIVEMVKERQGVDFTTALEWLSSSFGISGPIRDLRKAKNRPDIRRRAFEFWQARDDSGVLTLFAQGRRFSPDMLRSAGLVAGSAAAFLTSLNGDDESRDEAISVGLAYRPDEALHAGFRSPSLSPFVRGTQVFIPLADLRGRLVGLMARQIAGEGPKYRFTTGFKKSEILYRGDHVRRQIERRQAIGVLDGADERFDLCICEGVFDALRLESLGIPAVATLGATISDRQLELISELAGDALEIGAVLRVHLFFDADKAGRRGAVDSLPRLLKQGAESDFLVDLVGADPPSEAKADPNVLLADLSQQAAKELVASSLVSALDALAAIAIDQRFEDAPIVVENLDPAGSIILQNSLARQLRALDWPRIWQKLAPDRVTTSTDQASRQSALHRIYEQLARAESASTAGGSIELALPEPFTGFERDADASLLHAMILAKESTDSREYPVDVAAWERIEQGAPLFLALIEKELSRPKPPQRPYLAHYEAKESGAPRLKCGPCPEESIQQQYVLTELLRIRPDRREFAERIPAVRFWADHPHLVVTGVDKPAMAVSFGYQIDMRALEERPDRTKRRDMFRPFLDCWNTFILHVGSRMERMRSDLIYVARLDIKGFYDHVPRHAVERVLKSAIPESDTFEALEVAPLFGCDTSGDRRQLLISWLLDHSLGTSIDGYRYASPISGEVTSKGGGAKGLPQGPTLSSYLANIVLFPLDAELVRRIEALDSDAMSKHGSRACGGLYARYVDDMIIAANSPEELRALRSTIEAQLEPLGLELNEKSEHLEPMTAEEARNWIVERRGAGFIAYGDADDQPSPATDIRTGWSDIPTLDRRTALSLLYWSAFDDPRQTPRRDFDDMLDKVARADSLRSSDLGHIARRAALRAALDAFSDGATDEEARFAAFEARFLSFIDRVKALQSPLTLRVKPQDLPVSQALVAARYFIAALTGIERLVLGNPERNPTFSDDVRSDIDAAKMALIGWILNNNLLKRLQGFLIPLESEALVSSMLRPQLEIQRATLEERAAQAVRLRVATSRSPFEVSRRVRGTAPNAASAHSVRLGWFRTFCPDGLAEAVDASPSHLFHQIAAEIQSESGHLSQEDATSGLTPAALIDATKAAAEGAIQKLKIQQELQALDIAAAFRSLTGLDEALEPKLKMRAVSALLSLSTGPLQAQVLGRRPGLVEAIAPGCVIIPAPPIAGQPGLFCYDPTLRTVHAVIVDPTFDPAKDLPPELNWRDAQVVGGPPRWTAALSEDVGFLLDPATKTRAIDGDLNTVANVFEGLIASSDHQHSERCALVHVFALIGPQSKDAQIANGCVYFSLSWRLPRTVSDQLIFERRGDGLSIQRSPHAGVDLWRTGQSVSDLFAIAADEDEDEGLKLDPAKLQDRIKRVAFSRLRGRWINGAQVATARANKSLPKSLTRILKALRETAGPDEHVGPLALEFLLSGRAMRCRITLGSAAQISGGWARYLESVGGRTLSSGDEEGLFSRADTRPGLPRTSRALARAADSISQWADRSDSVRCRQVLQATALGFEIASFRQEVRDTVLASLSLLKISDRERLAMVRPDIASMGSHGQVFLIEPRFAGQDSASSAYDQEQQAGDCWRRPKIEPLLRVVPTES